MIADQQPASPGATDPRIRWAQNTTVDQDARSWAGIFDAADKAADPPWIRIRCDEATVLLIAEAVIRAKYPDRTAFHVAPDGDSMRTARAVLAALRGEQP